MDAGSSPAAGAPQCGKVDVAGHGGGCNNRASTLATLAEDSYEFTRLLPRSDLMDAVLRGDEAAMRNPVLNDTAELARSLWPNCSARPAGALIYYTVRPHATGTGSTPYFWGGELEAARLLAREATVQGMALDAELSKTARRGTLNHNSCRYCRSGYAGLPGGRRSTPGRRSATGS